MSRRQLKSEVDGENQTGGTIKATQEVIDQLLSVELPSVLLQPELY
jgi:hypothetical protein